MHVDWYISDDNPRFLQMCEAVLRSVDDGSEDATEQACFEIIMDSLAQVPVETGALASTADYKVFPDKDGEIIGVVGYAGASTTALMASSGPKISATPTGAISRDIGPYADKYSGTVGTVGALISQGFIGGIRGTYGDEINPRSGIPVSRYAGIVHEDLSLQHPRGGKAKFLEDPVRAYTAKFESVAEEHWRWAISSVWHKKQGYRGHTKRKVASKRLIKWNKEAVTERQQKAAASEAARRKRVRYSHTSLQRTYHAAHPLNGGKK